AGLQLVPVGHEFENQHSLASWPRCVSVSSDLHAEVIAQEALHDIQLCQIGLCAAFNNIDRLTHRCRNRFGLREAASSIHGALGRVVDLASRHSVLGFEANRHAAPAEGTAYTALLPVSPLLHESARARLVKAQRVGLQ